MFRFTIRDVLWLTVVVALGVAWWQAWAGQELWRGRARFLKNYLEIERVDVRWGNDGTTSATPQEEIAATPIHP